MREIKSFLCVAFAALIASKCLDFVAPWIPVYMGMGRDMDPSIYLPIASTFRGVSWLMFNLVVAVWNYKEAKREESNPVLWCFLSLFLGVLGLVLFYSYAGYIKTQKAR
ncbi:hypothetical protein [Coraliomargarita parva]|uniref:hypothetical protein n=1 Tax=Coraliomargarita parva TaxID=3014050 RepID=UPI0022B5DFF1|nr:hypothetical protein [Coraliomargarita parva]